MAPIFEQAATELEPEVRLVKVDSDAAPELLQRFSIQSTRLFWHSTYDHTTRATVEIGVVPRYGRDQEVLYLCNQS
jgi:hypothetical protein